MTLRIPLDHLQSKAWDMLQPGQTVALPWGRGAGKSYCARAFIHHQALSRPGIHIGILYPSLKQARQVLWTPHLFPDYYGALKPYIKHLDRTLLEATYTTGARVSTWGAENASGILGQRFAVIVQDEADDIDPAVEHAIVEPTMSKIGREAIWFKAGTFRRGRHGVLFADYQRALQGKPGYKTLRVRSCESPQVDQEWLAQVKDKIPSAIFAREYDADPDSIEGLVYPFDEQFHVREPPPHFVFNEYIAGVDHGWTDPGVILLIGIHGHGNDAIAWILDEHYETELPNHEWDTRAKRWDTLVDTFWCDPSRPDRIRDLRNAGCNARAADNDIQAGVGRVADLLFKRTASDGTEWARLYVHPKCTNTIWELQNYRRKRDPSDREQYLEAILDKHNHCLAAGTLILTDRGEVPIESVRTTDQVLTRSGWRDVLWSGCTGRGQPLWSAETTKGVLEGTAEHRVWTENRGWVRLDALRYADMLVSWENMDDVSLSATREPPSAVTPTHPTRTPPGTFERAQADTCTGSFGKPCAAPFLRSTTSTTRTTTRSTTCSAIWNAFRHLSISFGTWMRNAVSDSASTWIAFDTWLRNGTAQMLVASGTGSMLATSGAAESLYGRNASNAAVSSTTPTAATEPASVRPNAKPLGAARVASTMKLEPAQSAAKTSVPTATRRFGLAPATVVTSCSAERNADVYDLTVDGAHEFFANGALVHNSMDSLRYACISRFGRVQLGRVEVPGR